MEVSVNRLHPQGPSGAGRPRGPGPGPWCVLVTFAAGYLNSHVGLNARPVASNALRVSTQRCCCARTPLQGSQRLCLNLHLQAQDTEAKCLNLRHMLPLSQMPNVLWTVPWKDALFPRKKLVRSAMGVWSRYGIQASAAWPTSLGF